MKSICYTLTVIGLFAGASIAQAEEKQPASTADKDAYAIELIQRAASYLSQLEHFSVTAETWEDIVVDGKLLQFGKTVDIKLSRPSSVRLDISTTEPTRSIFVNGEDVTMIDLRTNFYGSTKGAGTLDETISMIDKKYGVQFPMEDLLFSKPFGNAAENAMSAQYLGTVNVLGVECDHVAFQHGVLDWQAWIETGPMPVLRKVVIHYKSDPLNPTTTAIFSDWDVVTPMPDFVFEFSPKAFQQEVQVLPPAK